MRKLLVLMLLVFTVSGIAIGAQAHGPGGGTLWADCNPAQSGPQPCPWASFVHTHCTLATNSNEFFVSAGGQNVGVGKHSQSPTDVDYYVIAPIVGQPPAGGIQNPCLDSFGI